MNPKIYETHNDTQTLKLLMMKCDHLAAARLFLMARGRGGENHMEDLVALATLLEEFARAGYQATAQMEANSKALPQAMELIRRAKENCGSMYDEINAFLTTTTYFDKDGTMRNGDGSRSIFDDVDK